MAAPHVSGVATLLRQLHPSWTPAQIKGVLMNQANRNMKNNDLTAPVSAALMGSGRVDALQSANAKSVAWPGSLSFELAPTPSDVVGRPELPGEELPQQAARLHRDRSRIATRTSTPRSRASRSRPTARPSAPAGRSPERRTGAAGVGRLTLDPSDVRGRAGVRLVLHPRRAWTGPSGEPEREPDRRPAAPVARGAAGHVGQRLSETASTSPTEPGDVGAVEGAAAGLVRRPLPPRDDRPGREPR